VLKALQELFLEVFSKPVDDWPFMSLASMLDPETMKRINHKCLSHKGHGTHETGVKSSMKCKVTDISCLCVSGSVSKDKTKVKQMDLTPCPEGVQSGLRGERVNSKAKFTFSKCYMLGLADSICLFGFGSKSHGWRFHWIKVRAAMENHGWFKIVTIAIYSKFLEVKCLKHSWFYSCMHILYAQIHLIHCEHINENASA
jgi:hypothetical protein